MKKVLKFYATWCEPCKVMSQILQGIDTEITIENVDVDENAELARQYDVRTVPTLVMVNNSYVEKRIAGLRTTQELEKWLNE